MSVSENPEGNIEEILERHAPRDTRPRCGACGAPAHRYGTGDPHHKFDAIACVNVLRADLEALAAAYREQQRRIEELEAEKERLQGSHDRIHLQLSDRAAAQNKVEARLQAALEALREIADYAPSAEHVENAHQLIHVMAERAWRALAAQPEAQEEGSA